MFDYMIRILPNNRILVRDTDSGEVEVLQPREVVGFFEEKLSEQIKKQDEEDANISKIKEEIEGKWVNSSTWEDHLRSWRHGD